LERELDRVLKASGSPDAPCPLTAAELQRLVVEYLNDYDAELALLPERAGEGHWNLWQWDEPGRFEEDSYFVVVAVWPAGLGFVCGYGPQHTTGFPVSPLTPATYLVVGLAQVELGDHQRFTIPFLFGASVLMTLASVALGVFPA
jgi:hypothetical protein